MYQGIIFDLDGTLWDSTLQILPAWNTALRRHEKQIRLTHERLKSLMGKTAAEIAGQLLPEYPPEESFSIIKECCKEELIYLKKSGGTLYPRLNEVLQTLSCQNELYIVSNCQEGYIDAFLDFHDLRRYFTDYQWEGNPGRSKGENIKEVMIRNQLASAIYVGDTQGDLDAADFAAIPFIYAAYGFGQVNRAVPKIESPAELLPLCD